MLFQFRSVSDSLALPLRGRAVEQESWFNYDFSTITIVVHVHGQYCCCQLLLGLSSGSNGVTERPRQGEEAWLVSDSCFIGHLQIPESWHEVSTRCDCGGSP